MAASRPQRISSEVEGLNLANRPSCPVEVAYLINTWPALPGAAMSYFETSVYPCQRYNNKEKKI